MFDDNFEQHLDEAFGDDEHAKAAARADIRAMNDHMAADPTEAHEFIAGELWTLLRELGIRGGQMLIMGQDTEVFAGIPPRERRLGPGQSAIFTARIPAGRSPSRTWPHSGLVLRTPSDPVLSQHDVVFLVPAYIDVAMHRSSTTAARQVAQAAEVITALECTEPGGFTIAMTSKELLDDPDTSLREYIATEGELVGAVRLPAGALRPDPGNDACVDLLVLQRHFGEPVKPHLFLRSLVYESGGLEAHLNAYYLANPGQLLGRVAVQPTAWTPAELTVLPSEQGLLRDLDAGLGSIVEFARRAGVTADTIASPLEAYEINLDAPISYRPVDLPTDAHIVDLDAVRERVNQQRAERERPDPGSPPPRPSGPGPGLGM